MKLMEEKERRQTKDYGNIDYVSKKRRVETSFHVSPLQLIIHWVAVFADASPFQLNSCFNGDTVMRREKGIKKPLCM